MYFTMDKLFETPGFPYIICRDACVNLEKIILLTMKAYQKIIRKLQK